MSFKIGDKVTHPHVQGHVGTILSLFGGWAGEAYLEVTWEGWSEGHNGSEEDRVDVPEDSCWNVPERTTTLYMPDIRTTADRVIEKIKFIREKRLALGYKY
jgi:hypothetical protein